MSPFDPNAIKPFTVIRLPYQFDSVSSLKRFVVVGHNEGYAICLKATTKVSLYVKNKDMMAGCVYYKAGELDFFPQATAIQPDNQIPIKLAYIKQCKRDGTVEILGPLPSTFEEYLIGAVDDSITMEERKKTRIRKLVATYPL